MVIKGIKSNSTISKAHSISDEFKHVQIKDYRLVKRIKTTAEILEKNPECSIPKACKNKAQLKGTYRLLDNPKLSSDIIIDSHRQETIKRTKGHNIVLIHQDSCILDYTNHKKTQGLGPVGTSKFLSGLMMHTAFCTTTTGVPLGVLAQKMWARDPESRGKRKLRGQLSIQEKESYKWLELLDASLQGLPKDLIAVTVADREADIYEFFYKAARDKRHLLIRAAHDRRIAQEQKKLFRQIQNCPVIGECLLKLPRNSKLNLVEREAKFTVKSCAVDLCPPKGGKSPDIKLSAVCVEELSPPQGITPVKWLLLTTFQVKTFEEAMEKVHWYCERWKIERFHFVLKNGCEIEELQLESSERLKNAIALYSVLAWKLTWITYQSRETPDVPCTVILDEREWKVLYCLVNPKSRPPKKAPNLMEAVVLIARLGGFLARKNDGNPGVKVLWHGYQRFYNALETLSALDLSPFS